MSFLARAVLSYRDAVKLAKTEALQEPQYSRFLSTDILLECSISIGPPPPLVQYLCWLAENRWLYDARLVRPSVACDI